MRRIIAIGDLHGSIGALTDIAQRLGIVDQALHLDMPKTDLVFVGDICDRGYNSKDIYELVVRWQQESGPQGSRVWFILGNHEVMNAWGMRHYNTPEEYLSFDPSSPSAGQRAHAEAFEPGGWLFSWLAEQHAVVQIGPLVFAHGDLPMAVAEWAVGEIDERVMAAFKRTAAKPGAGALPAALFGPNESVLWCREAQFGRPRGYAAALRRFLEKNNATAWICGHTPAEDGSFRLGYEGRYLCIDTAMTFRRLGAGRISALVVENGNARACYFDGYDVQSLPVKLAMSKRE